MFKPLSLFSDKEIPLLVSFFTRPELVRLHSEQALVEGFFLSNNQSTIKIVNTIPINSVPRFRYISTKEILGLDFKESAIKKKENDKNNIAI